MNDELRRLDAEVAKALGYQGVRFNDHGLLRCDTLRDDGTHHSGLVPHFSSDPEDSILLEKCLRMLHVEFLLAFLKDGTVAPIMSRNFTPSPGFFDSPGLDRLMSYDSKEEAIARVFLGAHRAGLLEAST